MVTEVKEKVITLIDLEKQYGGIELQLKQLEKAKEGIRSQILSQFETTYGHQGFTYESPETGGILQRVFQIRMDIDSEKLKRLIPQEKWDLVKKEVVDMDKFMSALKVNLINPINIQEAVSDKEIEKLVWRKK